MHKEFIPSGQTVILHSIVIFGTTKPFLHLDYALNTQPFLTKNSMCSVYPTYFICMMGKHHENLFKLSKNKTESQLVDTLLKTLKGNNSWCLPLYFEVDAAKIVNITNFNILWHQSKHLVAHSI